MKIAHFVNFTLSIVHLAIWYYLLHKVLASVNASELMWFLYWVYVPVGLVLSAVRVAILKQNEKATK